MRRIYIEFKWNGQIEKNVQLYAKNIIKSLLVNPESGRLPLSLN